MECRRRLEQYFRVNGVPFQSMTHPPAFTAPEVAACQHVPGKQVAKVVMAKVGEQLVMLVLPANKHVDFRLLAEELHAPGARLAQEEEFQNLFPDCLLGAMPPLGNLYDVPVYMDVSLTDDPEIVFQAGTHTDTMKLRYDDYARLVQPVIARFTL